MDDATQKTAHEDLHSEQGGIRGDRPARATNPVIKVEDLAWLEFEKPDLDAAERFAHDFGLATAYRSEAELHLRATLPGSQAVIIRRGPRSRFVGPRLPRLLPARTSSGWPAPPGPTCRSGAARGGGAVVQLADPVGSRCGWWHDGSSCPGCRNARRCRSTSARCAGVNATQRPPSEPARSSGSATWCWGPPSFGRALDWYLDTLGLIVSDFLYFDGQRERGPTMAFIRCDRGGDAGRPPHPGHALGPGTGYVHSAYQVADLDAVAAGGEYLKERGYRRAWGIGRHIQGSQIFDYWRDPDS